MIKEQLPKVSFESLIKIIRAYYTFCKDKPLTIEELSKKSNIKKFQLDNSEDFLKDFNIIIEQESGLKISESGIEFIDSMTLSEEKGMEKLAEIISENEFVLDIKKYLEFNPIATKDDIKQLIINNSNADISITDHKTSVNCIYDLLVKAQIIKIKPKLPVTTKKKDDKETKPEPILVKTKLSEITPIVINIQIDLKSDIDEEKIKEKLVRIKDFIEEEFNL